MEVRRRPLERDRDLSARDDDPPSRPGEKLWEAIAYHVSMLSDEARNRAFAQAIDTVVQPGMRVLDLGAGCGPWAIRAVERGASRVVALERNPAVLPLLAASIDEAGLAGRIAIVAGDSRAIDLQETFDVIVSETIGSQAFDEGIVPILRDARSRWLAPGGALIPARVGLRAAPGRRVFARPTPPVGAGLSSAFVRIQALHRQFPMPIPEGCRIETLADPISVVDVELATAEAEPDQSALTAAFEVADAAAIEGFAVWVHAELAPGVTLSSRDCPSWTQMFYPIEPLPAGRGEVSFCLDARPSSLQWTATKDGVEQMSSPHLARAWWHAHTR